MKHAFPIMFVLLFVLAVAQSCTISVLDENLEVAELIIVSTEHQRNEAWNRIEVLEHAIIEQNEQCAEQPPRLYRGPYYPEEELQQNQEDTAPLSC